MNWDRTVRRILEIAGEESGELLHRLLVGEHEKSLDRLCAGLHYLAAEVYHADPSPEPSLSAGLAWTLLDASHCRARKRCAAEDRVLAKIRERDAQLMAEPKKQNPPPVEMPTEVETGEAAPPTEIWEGPYCSAACPLSTRWRHRAVHALPAIPTRPDDETLRHRLGLLVCRHRPTEAQT